MGWGQQLEKGLLTCSTGLEWRELRLLAQRTTIPRKGFCSIRAQTFYYYILYNIVVILYIFLLCRLKINHVIEYK
jgi:hypothetical protein